MGNCLIKGRQTCSQTCSSLAPLEVNTHHSVQSESLCVVFKMPKLLPVLYTRLVPFTGHKNILQAVFDSFLFIKCSSHSDWLNILRFSCFYIIPPTGGNIIILIKISMELYRVSQVWLRPHKQENKLNSLKDKCKLFVSRWSDAERYAFCLLAQMINWNKAYQNPKKWKWQEYKQWHDYIRFLQLMMLEQCHFLGCLSSNEA